MTQTAIEKVDPATLEQLAQMVTTSGESSTYNPVLATSFIKWAAANTNLISPAMACPNLPLGFELAFTRVDINPDPKLKEVYRQSDGGLSLTKVGLEKIQKGAGIRLDPKLTRKLDNGEDPLFTVYEFVGHFRDFDGTICPVKGTKELDLHDESAEVQKIRSRQKSQAAGDNEINELRRFISGHAESKAKNRGIRSFGIKSSYSDEELRKPFTCIRLIRTGRCDDPQTQMMLTRMIHEEYQASEQSLFGSAKHPQLTVGKEPEALPEARIEPSAASQSPTESSAAPGGMPGFAATAETAPQTKPCTPDVCYGKESSGHVRACSIPLDPAASTAAPAPEAWIVTVGKRAGLKVNDPQVTDEDLSSLVSHFDFSLESQDLPAEMIEKLKGERQHVFNEVARRKKG